MDASQRVTKIKHTKNPFIGTAYHHEHLNNRIEPSINLKFHPKVFRNRTMTLMNMNEHQEIKWAVSFIAFIISTLSIILWLISHWYFPVSCVKLDITYIRHAMIFWNFKKGTTKGTRKNYEPKLFKGLVEQNTFPKYPTFNMQFEKTVPKLFIINKERRHRRPKQQVSILMRFQLHKWLNWFRNITPSQNSG